MNSKYSNKEAMQELFRAMKQAISVLNKTKVNLEAIVRHCNPDYKITLSDAKSLMNGLINAKYVRWTDYMQKRYFQPSKSGDEKWSIYLASNLHDLAEQADKLRIQRDEDVPWREEAGVGS